MSPHHENFLNPLIPSMITTHAPNYNSYYFDKPGENSSVPTPMPTLGGGFHPIVDTVVGPTPLGCNVQENPEAKKMEEKFEML